MFGFYPPDLYWRPTLAFVLIFVALAPVLFSVVPRKLLWFSAIYPGLAYWLLWGGTIFFPIAIYLGFVAGYLAFRVAERGPSFLPPLAAGVATLLWWFAVAGPLTHALPDVGITPVQSKQFGGFMLSVTIGITGIAFSLPLGVLLALGRRSDLFLVKTICVGFIEFIRGVPLITLLLVASFLLNIFMPPGTNFDIILRVVIMVTLFSAAYMAEVIRGGLAALPRGQYEGADSLGLGYWQATRLIIMPQALKILDPGHRQHLHRAVQGHDARRDHRPARPRRPHHLGPRQRRVERHGVGALRLRRRDVLRLLLRHVEVLATPGAPSQDRPRLRGG